MKRKTAREILTDSFRELAQDKPVDKITVKDIAVNCGYSQATFYRHFKGKYDLIAWSYAHSVANIMGRVTADGLPWRQTLLDGVLSFEEEKDYLANLFRHTAGHDSFAKYMMEINYDVLKRYILDTSGADELDKSTDLYARLYVHGTVNITCEWILGLFEATPEELAAVFEKSVPEPLWSYLLP